MFSTHAEILIYVYKGKYLGMAHRIGQLVFPNWSSVYSGSDMHVP